MKSVFTDLLSESLQKCCHVLDDWIKVTDAVMDREIKAVHALDAFEIGVRAFGLITQHDGLWKALEPHVLLLSSGARADAEYIPGQHDLKRDIELWEMKAGRLSVEFAFVCYERPEFNTSDNWDWIKECQEYGLKINDCNDLLSDRFEDLIQPRRNWVVMKTGDSTLVKWRDNVGMLKHAAIEVLNEIELLPPPDARLSLAYNEHMAAMDRMTEKYIKERV